MNEHEVRREDQGSGHRSHSSLPACACAFLCLVLLSPARAAPPPGLPGEEITEQYLRQLVPPDSIKAHVPASSPAAPTWLDDAMKSWDAPDLPTQVASDRTFIPLGKGALFVPRMTDAQLEPDVEAIDSTGQLMGRGKPGAAISLLPGHYFVMVGSGAHKQMMVREATVTEGRTTPVAPDWSALVVEVVNESNLPIRADYELVRIDEVEIFGRGSGADPGMGEQPRTWVLKPGLYKILGVGESYNTLRNFITVRLLPGSLTRILLVMDDADMKITGGGALEVAVANRGKRDWKWGLDLGGSLLFNATIDQPTGPTEVVRTNTSALEMLANGWVRYTNGRRDWNTSLRLDEGFTVPDLDFSRIGVATDDLRLRSLFIWRLLKWLGPYGRTDAETDIFVKHEHLDEKSGEKYFYVVDQTKQRLEVDSAASFATEAAFSPLALQLGLGVNADIVDVRLLKTRFRAGLGYSYKSVRDKYVDLNRSALDTAVLNGPDSTMITQSRILQRAGSASTHEAGPEAALLLDLRLGKFATASAEVRWFAPIAPDERFSNPDIYLEGLLSWHIVRSVSLDYEYTYTLTQPTDPTLRQNLQQHSVRIRVSLQTK
jgi:hypothetical protein